jgi:hypothetical protein
MNLKYLFEEYRKKITLFFQGENETRVRITPVNPVTLCFTEYNLNKEFSEELAKRSVKVVRLSILLGIITYIAFGLKYMLLYSTDEYLFYRALGIIEFSVVIALTFSPLYKKYSQLIISCLILMGGFNVVMISLDNGLYAGLIVTSIYAHSLLRFRFLYASITTWLLIISYLVILVTLPGVPDNVVINNVLFLVTANLLGMVASYSIEFYMKADYIKSKRLQEKTSIIKVELDRKSRELESARQIQMSMLPQKLPHHPLIDLSVSMKTASEIGGDYYDYHLDDDDTLTFAIGDATGHGAQAGAMVTALKVLFSNYASQLDITEFMNKADQTIKQIKLPRLYMSLAVGRLTGNILEITGVGMPPLMIYRAKTNTIERINLKGLPLGSFMELKYIKETTELFPGDSLLLMTDGFPELFNKEREMFGYDRIEQVFHSEAKHTPEKVNKRFNDISEEWMRDFTQMDDVTVMVMKMKKTAVRNSSLVDLSTLIMNRMS